MPSAPTTKSALYLVPSWQMAMALAALPLTSSSYSMSTTRAFVVSLAPSSTARSSSPMCRFALWKSQKGVPHSFSYSWKSISLILLPFQPIMLHSRGEVACFERYSSRPQDMRTREELGKHWIPAPISPISGVDSRMWTLWPARRIDMAAPRPPKPAPTMMTYQWALVEAREIREEEITSSLLDSSLCCFWITSGLTPVMMSRVWCCLRKKANLTVNDGEKKANASVAVCRPSTVWTFQVHSHYLNGITYHHLRPPIATHTRDSWLADDYWTDARRHGIGAYRASLASRGHGVV